MSPYIESVHETRELIGVEVGCGARRGSGCENDDNNIACTS
jgi:hypothetical protein